MNMKIVNCTPHKLNIHTPAGVVTMEPSGIIPRVETVEESLPPIEGIPLVTSAYGQISGLPDPEEGTFFVVSQLVAAAAKREDLLFPGKLLRDEKGRPCGCEGLAKLA